MDTMDENLANDVIWGAHALARELGLPLRKIYYLLEQGRIPAGRIGANWVASRKALREYFGKLTGSEPAA